ncbi:class I SAM-dependent methyltransferase [Thalassobaculum sp.]|uniref:SAM-dependent methyltransferase n=1 Tax=Thalassobaculum sp. TaxID=2022740 RepID=UPI0032EE5A70
MMIEIAAYDSREAAAIARIHATTAPPESRSEVFDATDYPVRIEHLGQVGTMLGSLHVFAKIGLAMQKELRGLSDDDLATLGRAARGVVELQRSIDPGTRPMIPLGGLLGAYLICRKIVGMPRHARILDIGPGCGILSLFLAEREDIERYAQIEVTQSLYIAQAQVNRIAFGDLAVDLVSDGGVGADSRCVHYPWWEIDRAFEDTYDVIMMNENMCEMPGTAFRRYLAGTRRTLAKDGLLLISGVGRTLSPDVLADRLAALREFEFRPVVANQAYYHGGPLSAPNLLLVAEGHPRYATAGNQYDQLAFDESDPLVRSIYGLDRPDLPLLPRNALIGEIAGRLRS